MFRRGPQFIIWVQNNGFYLFKKWEINWPLWRQTPYFVMPPPTRGDTACNYSEKQWVEIPSWYPFICLSCCFNWTGVSLHPGRTGINPSSSLRYHLGNHCNALVHSLQVSNQENWGQCILYLWNLGAMEKCFGYKLVKSTFHITL